MRLISADGKKSVDIGKSDIWVSVYSTAIETFGHKRKKVELALAFMESGMCDSANGYETARQFNVIRDEFSKIPPEKAIYDINDRKKKAPWTGKISPVITSCGNLYMTAEGTDLFSEVVGILSYAEIMNVSIKVE